MRRYTLTLLLLFVLSLTLHAQETESLDPIYLYHENAFWKWTTADGVTQLADVPAEKEGLSISPNRRWAVYQVIAPLTQIEIENECPCGGGAFATDLWLVDLNTGEHLLIAGQPAEVETASDEMVRSFPVWSPDGTQLAWVDGSEVGDLTIYDIASGQTRVVAEGLRQLGLVSNSVALEGWSKAGIYKEHEIYDDQLNVVAYEWHFYDPDTGALTVIPVARADQGFTYYVDYGVGAFSPINERGAVLTQLDDVWTLTNLADNSVQTVTRAILRTVSENAPETSLRILPAKQSEEDGYTWTVETADGATFMTSDLYPRLSPDGSRVLIVDRSGADHNVLVVHDPATEGSSGLIELPWIAERVIWGTTAYELAPAGDTVITSPTCEGGRLPFRLMRNGTAWVNDTTPNNVRAEPSVSAEKVGEIAAGDWFKVVDGPHCANGITWWYVDYIAGIEGWTAEGVDAEYFLQPGCPPTRCSRG